MPKQDGPGLYNIFIQDNDFSQVRTTNLVSDGAPHDDPYWGSCVATYGVRDRLVISGNVCRGHFNIHDKKHSHGGIMFSPVFCGGGNGPGHGGSSFEKCKNEDMYPGTPAITVTGTTFFKYDEKGPVKPGKEVGHFPGDTWQTCGARDADNWGGPYAGGKFPAARINNCVMSSGGWPSDSGHYGCADPSFILNSCGDVQWSDGGAEGYGWYCFNGGGGETYTDIENGKSVTYAPDMYKSDKWHKYADSCIHLSCNLPAYDSWAKMWRCIDDMDAASMYARDLAVAASRRGHLNTIDFSGDLFDSTKGGYFKFDASKGKQGQFCWDSKYDATGELCYDYDYTLNPDVKMWNKNRNGYYKISVDKDSQSLQFYCMESGSEQLTKNC